MASTYFFEFLSLCCDRYSIRLHGLQLYDSQSSGIPDTAARARILRVMAARLKLSGEFDLDEIAQLTPGCVMLSGLLVPCLSVSFCVAVRSSLSSYLSYFSLSFFLISLCPVASWARICLH
jgi:hypothetical protein